MSVERERERRICGSELELPAVFRERTGMWFGVGMEML